MRVLIIAKHLPISADAASERPEASHTRSGGTGRREKVDPSWLGRAADSPVATNQRVAPQRLGSEVPWPAFQCASRVRVDAGEDWVAYRRVNESFAAAIVDNHRPGDVVVVCDHQLALVPALVRARKPGVKIGFFLHAPFPALEALRQLPWRAELLSGILGADLIGFHGLTSAEHFKLSLVDVLGLEPSSLGFVQAGRVVRLGVYPVGIDTAEYERQARAPDLEHDITRLRELAGGKPIVLSVISGDSMHDSSSCCARRLLARAPKLAERVHFVELVAPNSDDPSSGTQPSRREMSCLYRAADVALILALGHQTSLVEKEYVASRIYESGVLIVPEPSDSARELREALRVNPHDIDTTVRALERALEMKCVEQRFRMRSLRARVVRNDARRWAQQLIADLLECPRAAGSEEQEQLLLKQLAELRYTRSLELFLAYDGTLVPFAPLPELAAPDSEAYRLLEQLAHEQGRLQEARKRIVRVNRREDFELVDGAKVLEVRRRGIHAGRVATAVLARAGESGVIAAGSDAIDEALFAAVPPVAITIHVGQSPTQAAYQVSNPARLRHVLRVLVAAEQAS